MTRTLVLGGTTEASLLAQALAAIGADAVFSYAGRTDAPIGQPLPTRVGGFGGVDGLTAYLRNEGIGAVVDATHPFAAQISRNAIAACAAAGVPLLGLQRSAWLPGPGDTWTLVSGLEQAVAALPAERSRVFLAIGKQNLDAFVGLPHHYLLRLVDAPATPPMPNCTVILARGPFDTASDTALLQDHAITHLVAKNAGGTGAEAKLIAARTLRLPVILIDRPDLPPRQVVQSVSEVMAWLDHPADLGV